MTDPSDRAPHEQPSITLRPVIREIVRTGFFGNPIRLLVDRIHVVPYRSDDDEENGAYRLWLSDGEKTIQAVLKPEIHPFVTSRTIRDGSVVLLTKYSLEKAKRRNGQGEVLYLAIEDMESVDHDGRDGISFILEEIRTPAETPTRNTPGSKLKNVIFPGLQSSDDVSPDQRGSPNGERGRKRSFSELSPSPTPSKPKNRKVVPQKHDTTAITNTTTSFTHPKTGAATGTRSTSGFSFLARPRTQPSPEAKRSGSRTTQTNPGSSQSIARPLSLTQLAKITGPPQTLLRNRVVNVLIVITEVSPNIITRAHLTHLDLPPSRNLRIMDPSTSKKVQLTVFVDAEEFLPKVGTVALFRSVTTHEWDGGSLKAYPRDCKGKEWYVPWPWGVEGCDVRAMKHWWEARALAGL